MRKDKDTFLGETLLAWVQAKVDEWEEHYESNYAAKHAEYDRIWRGIWAVEDKTRASERSHIVAPASAQAVESSVAEVEEAIFGRGDVFDIRDNTGDENPGDMAQLREELLLDFKKRRFRRANSECLLNGAVVGTGIMELVLDQVTKVVPATDPIDKNTRAVGVEESEVVVIDYRPVHPKNFRIDPAATTVEEALGVAIDEYVPCHQVEQLQESGVYRDDVVIGTASWDTNISADQTLSQQPRTQCRLIKYYGLVPTDLLKEDMDAPGEDPLAEYELEREDNLDDMYTEAIVVIDATSGAVLKAEAAPFMMRARPVIAYGWDIVPGRFWGRGVVEKGYNTQKAIDAELRARADALALTTHPMMAVDGTRMPRGMNATIQPGKTLITSGNPNEVLRPMHFGDVGQITFAQADALGQMHQQATGAVDTAGMASGMGDARSGAVSMSLSGIIKRHKRTLINFQEDFLIPLVERAAWMYMQYDPDRFPARDYEFTIDGSMGIMAREYETQGLTQLLNTTGKDSPAYLALITSVIENMQLSNREELINQIVEGSKPDPAAIEAQQRQAQLQEQLLQSQISAFNAQANESNKRAEKYEFEKRAIPIELENERIEAVSKNLSVGDADDREFEKRWKTADMMLKERKVDIEASKTLTDQVTRITQQSPQGDNDGTTTQTGGSGRSSQTDQR